MELAAILGMVAVVCTLAVLQYRWTAEIGRSEQQRLKGTLTTDVRGFAQEFSYDFERLCETHEVDPKFRRTTWKLASFASTRNGRASHRAPICWRA